MVGGGRRRTWKRFAVDVVMVADDTFNENRR